jgi:hypothetical protein
MVGGRAVGGLAPIATRGTGAGRLSMPRWTARVSARGE